MATYMKVDIIKGQITGQGICKYVGNERYEGTFINGIRSGQGKYLL